MVGVHKSLSDLCALKTKQTFPTLFSFLSELILRTSLARVRFAPHPVRLAPAEMQTQRVPGRKRGRPPLHSTRVQMAVHNLYSASSASVPAVTIPKKRGRKPRYKVCLRHLLIPDRVGHSSAAKCHGRQAWVITG